MTTLGYARKEADDRSRRGSRMSTYSAGAGSVGSVQSLAQNIMQFNGNRKGSKIEKSKDNDEKFERFNDAALDERISEIQKRIGSQSPDPKNVEDAEARPDG